MKLSVIILNYNVRYFLELCILSVLKATEGLAAEIIVVDNNSPDDSCEMVKRSFPDITLVENSENIGFSKANNQGVAIAKGEYICILNPDTVVGEGVFTKILEISSQFKDIGLISTRLIDGLGKFLPESKRNIPLPLTSFKRLFGVKLGGAKSYYADHITDVGVGAVDVLVGAFMWAKKDIYLMVGGFDEDYFMYGEDIDLSYKMTKKGLQNYYIGSLSVLHYKGESTDRNITYIKRFYGAMRLFYSKHFKKNWIIDFMVSIGIRLASLVQRVKNQKVDVRIVDTHYLVSENIDLKNKLSTVLRQDVEMISIESIKNLGNTNNEIIFDNDYLSFNQIIDGMNLLQDKNLTFRIKPAGCNYILGSDFTDGKGQIITF